MGSSMIDSATILPARVLPASLSILVIVFSLGSCWNQACAQQTLEEGVTPLIEEGKIVGITKCAACHFDQYKDWKGSEHNGAFAILPTKYRNDASCLQCHLTGQVSDPTTHQFGVSCESCHGPGEQHARYALRFVNEIISEEGLAELRSKIRRLDLHQCVKCHVSKAHKKHPPYDREEVLPVPNANKPNRFFESIHREQAVLQSPSQSGKDDSVLPDSAVAIEF